MRLTMIAVALLLTGCAGQTELVKALAKDKACLCSKLTTIYGTHTLVRIGEGQTCPFDEGCTVRKP